MGREEGISKMPFMCGISVAVANWYLLAEPDGRGGETYVVHSTKKHDNHKPNQTSLVTYARQERILLQHLHIHGHSGHDSSFQRTVFSSIGTVECTRPPKKNTPEIGSRREETEPTYKYPLPKKPSMKKEKNQIASFDTIPLPTLQSPTKPIPSHPIPSYPPLSSSSKQSLECRPAELSSNNPSLPPTIQSPSPYFPKADSRIIYH